MNSGCTLSKKISYPECPLCVQCGEWVSCTLRKPGNEWVRAELEAVCEWICSDIDTYIKWIENKRAQYWELAEDAVFDGMSAVLKGLHTYKHDQQRYEKDGELKQGGKFDAWFKTIIDNACIKILKGEFREDKTRELLEQNPPPGDQAWKRLEISSYLERLYRHFPKQHEAIYLTKIEGYNIAEVAERSKWPCKPGAMRVRVHRGMHTLKSWLDDQEGG